MIDFLWLIPLGFAAGVLGSIIGLGGGIIAVPVMTFAGFPPTLAASNSLFAAFSNAVASTATYAKQKRIEYGIGLKLGLMCIPGTILGAFVSDGMTPVVFQILFALILVSSGANRVDNVSFQLSDDKLQKISDDLIADAIIDAKQKAAKALVPLKQKIVGVKSVVIHDNLMPYYDSPMRASFDGFAESMKSAPILSGDEEIRTNVSVVFYISQIE